MMAAVPEVTPDWQYVHVHAHIAGPEDSCRWRANAGSPVALDVRCTLIGMQVGVRKDTTVALVAAGISFMLLDLFPGPTVLLALGIGCAGVIGVRRDRAFGRTLMDAFVGIAVSLLVLIVWAVALH
jgi:hypothetical protein